MFISRTITLSILLILLLNISSSLSSHLSEAQTKNEEIVREQKQKQKRNHQKEQNFLRSRLISYKTPSTTTTTIIDSMVITKKKRELDELNPSVGPWPDCVGMFYWKCVDMIESEDDSLDVIPLHVWCPVTEDYVTDRVRVFYNIIGLVTEAPEIG